MTDQQNPHDLADQKEAPQPQADAGAHQPGVDDLAEKIQQAVTAALAEPRDMVLRAQAEVHNMRRRCEELRGRVRIHGSAGTTLRVIIPLPVSHHAIAQKPPFRDLANAGGALHEKA